MDTKFETELFSTDSCLVPALTATVTLRSFKILRSLMAQPLLSHYCDSIREFVMGGRSGELKGIGDFTMREFSEVNKPGLAELESVPLGWGLASRASDL